VLAPRARDEATTAGRLQNDRSEVMDWTCLQTSDIQGRVRFEMSRRIRRGWMFFTLVAQSDDIDSEGALSERSQTACRAA
jgi:hypothetical protein